MTPEQQARAFAAMALCGGVLGGAYDLLSPLRRGRVGAAAADLLFGLAAAALVILAALCLRCEAFRLYVGLAALLGFALYQLTLGTIVRILKEKLHGVYKKVKKIS